MNNKLSYTAAYIAVKFYGLTLNPKINAAFPSFIPTFYKNTLQFLPKHLSWNLKSLSSPFWRKFFVKWEEFLLPGDLMHIISRKYYTHHLLQNCLQNNYNQIVVLGAGFDHIGALWSKNKITCFEIDIPSMAAYKQQMLNQFHYNSPNLHVLEIQPKQHKVADLLKEHPAFDPSKKTVFITEGFFDYLSPKDAHSILIDIQNSCTCGTLISTFFDLNELPWFHRFMFKSGVTLVGESLKLHLSIKEFKNHLSQERFRINSFISYNQIENDFINPLQLAENLTVLKGFYMISANFTNNTAI